jgi:hypothetical protein
VVIAPQIPQIAADPKQVSREFRESIRIKKIWQLSKL